jgi:hypothetical protein
MAVGTAEALPPVDVVIKIFLGYVELQLLASPNVRVTVAIDAVVGAGQLSGWLGDA